MSRIPPMTTDPLPQAEQVRKTIAHMLRGGDASTLSPEGRARARDDAEFNRFLEEAVAARNKAAIDAAQRKHESKLVAQVDSQLADELAAIFPSERVWQRHLAEFRRFQEWCQHGGIRAMPAQSQVAAAYLMLSMVNDVSTMARLRRMAQSIRFVHQMVGHCLDDLIIEAGLRWAKAWRAEVEALADSPDDDGGTELHPDAAAAGREQEAESLPLAAARKEK